MTPKELIERQRVERKLFAREHAAFAVRPTAQEINLDELGSRPAASDLVRVVSFEEAAPIAVSEELIQQEREKFQELARRVSFLDFPFGEACWKDVSVRHSPILRKNYKRERWREEITKSIGKPISGEILDRAYSWIYFRNQEQSTKAYNVRVRQRLWVFGVFIKNIYKSEWEPSDLLVCFTPEDVEAAIDRHFTNGFSTSKKTYKAMLASLYEILVASAERELLLMQKGDPTSVLWRVAKFFEELENLAMSENSRELLHELMEARLLFYLWFFPPSKELAKMTANTLLKEAEEKREVGGRRVVIPERLLELINFCIDKRRPLMIQRKKAKKRGKHQKLSKKFGISPPVTEKELRKAGEIVWEANQKYYPMFSDLSPEAVRSGIISLLAGGF